MKRCCLASLLTVLVACHVAQAQDSSKVGGNRDEESGQLLEAKFRSPADVDKPWAYWWWVNGNVTKESITRDLEEMKRKGFGGLLMFDSRNYHDDLLPPPPSRMEYMSPPWRELLKFSISEADRLGLRMSINLSSGAGALKGPWNVGDNAPKRLLWTSVSVRGPRRVACHLKRSDRYWDVAIVAARHGRPGDASNLPQKPTDDIGLSGPWQDMRTNVDSGENVVEVFDLTTKVDGQGNLVWNVPEGQWTLLRFACTVMEGHENEVDILSDQAVEEYFGRLGKAFLKEAGAAAGKTLTRLYSVSWEGAAPTWTFDLDDEFHQYRGYPMVRYLPVLAGMTVSNREVSQRFLRDYYKTLCDCFMNNCYGKLHSLSHDAGLKWHSESGGPWNRNLPSFQHADQLAFLARNDVPQGEFWYPYRGLNRPPAMAAHIYGKRLAATEAFTHMRQHWSVYPAVLKPGADAALCDGINQFIWHTFTASPVEYGKPGIEYFAGTHLNPNVTWWEQSHALLRYLARCQTMLRQGMFVADVCCYTGDRPYMHWGRGEKWSENASLTLEKGHTYDLVNTEVLLQRMSVKEGDLVLPDGMRYRILVVDLADNAASPQVLRRIIELTKAGATVVLGQRRPERALGLCYYPSSDKDVRRLAAELWGADPQLQATHSIGKGRVITGKGIDNVLRSQHIASDFEGPFDYIHRRKDGSDIYFLSGEGRADCIFRVAGMEPEFWDPQTGRTRHAVYYRETPDGRTVVPIGLPKNGSVFVVFRAPAKAEHVTSLSAPTDGWEIDGRIEGGVRLHLWRNGTYRLKTSQGKQLEVIAAGVPATQTLTGPWKLRFTPGWGAPQTAVFDRLTPWNEHADKGIRHYSGTAAYRSTFDLNKEQANKLIRLELGIVHHVAEVRVNGTPLGVVWTDPWTVELTGTVEAGKNELEIDVTNLWVNRLIGDADLPVEDRLTKTNALRREETGKHPHLRGYSSKEPLLKSGLLGPVQLVFGDEREVRF